MGLLEYQAMPSLRDVAHDRWLCSTQCVHNITAAGTPSSRSWAAPVRTTGTVQKRKADGPSITYKITPAGSLSSSRGGPAL
jgi:hypothetical protein